MPAPAVAAATLVCDTLCIPLYFIPALGNGNSSSGGGNATVIPPNPRLEDSLEALHMMGDNPTIMLALFSNMCPSPPARAGQHL